MFYLGGSTFPTTREQLISAVSEGIRGLVSVPPGRELVKIEGNFPNFDRVVVDLTGSNFDGDRLPPDPRGVGQRQGNLTAARFDVIGKPFYVHHGAVNLSVTGEQARLEFDRDAQGRPLLILVDGKNGHVDVQLTKQDVNTIVLMAARDAANSLGIQILEAQVNLSQLDDRSVAADVRVKAKKTFLTATLIFHGKVTVDDVLNAKVYDLTVDGEGTLGKMASGAIRPRLQKVNGSNFPLTALSLGQVRLHHLRVETGEVVKVTALFGS